MSPPKGTRFTSSIPALGRFAFIEPTSAESARAVYRGRFCPEADLTRAREQAGGQSFDRAANLLNSVRSAIALAVPSSVPKSTGLVRNSAAPYSIASSVSRQSGKAWTPLNTGNIVLDLWSNPQLRNRAKREAWNDWAASRKGLAMVWNLRAQLLETCSCNMLCPVGTASASWVLTRPLPSITNRRR